MNTDCAAQKTARPMPEIRVHLTLLKSSGAMLRPVRAKHAARNDAQGHSPCSPRRAWHPESGAFQESPFICVHLCSSAANFLKKPCSNVSDARRSSSVYTAGFFGSARCGLIRAPRAGDRRGGRATAADMEFSMMNVFL